MEEANHFMIGFTIIAIVMTISMFICGYFDGAIILSSILLIIGAFIVMPKMKNFLLESGRKILDFTTAFDLLSTFAIIIVGLCTSRDYHGEIEVTFWWWVLGGAVYFVATIMKNYLLYILVDIRDNLKKIADSKEQKNIDENKE